MERTIDRFYLHLLSAKDLNKSNCKETNIEILLEKKPSIDLCKFFYKEVGRDFFWRDRLKWSNQDTNLIIYKFFCICSCKLPFKIS